MPDSRNQGVYLFADCCVEVASRSLTRNGTPVAIESKTFHLLLAFLEGAPGAVLSHQDLAAKVWPDNAIVGDPANPSWKQNLQTQVSILRGVLQPGEFIETVPGLGYRFKAPVVREAEPTVELLERWSAGQHGDVPATREAEMVTVEGRGGWTGGYLMPEVAVGGRGRLTVSARNLTAGRIHVHVELKNERHWLTEPGKLGFVLEAESGWQEREIPLHRAEGFPAATINYLAFSDHEGAFRVRSVRLS